MFKFNLDKEEILRIQEIDFEETINSITERHPELKKIEAQLKLMDIDLRNARKERNPSVYLAGNYDWKGIGTTMSESVDAFDREWDVSLNLIYPLWDGGSQNQGLKP